MSNGVALSNSGLMAKGMRSGKRPPKQPTQEAGRDMIKNYNNVIKSHLKKTVSGGAKVERSKRRDNFRAGTRQQPLRSILQTGNGSTRSNDVDSSESASKRESQKSEELNRSLNWIVPPPILKYYLEEEIAIFTEHIEH